MLNLIGMHNVSPLTLHNVLRKKAKKQRVSFINGSELPQSDVLVFLSVKSLLQYRSILTNRDALVFVLDCKEKLQEVSNLKLVKATSVAKSVSRALRQPRVEKAPTHTKKDRIRAILEQRKSVGFLHYYNTLFYGVTNKDTRNKIKTLVFSWLAEKISDKTFAAKMTELMPKRGKARESMQALITITTSNEGVKLKGAIQEAKKCDDHDKIAKKHKVEAYDLRYAMATIAKGLGGNNAQPTRVPFGKKAKK